jgi:putative ABC transport system permease protein
MNRLSRLFHRRKQDAQLDSELRFHVEQQTAENIAAGMNPDEARRRDLAQFGGLEYIKKESRDARGVHFLETFAQDIRFALRMLRKSPGFTTVAILTLALGIGANTAIFSMAYAFLVRPLSLPNLDRVAAVSDGRYDRSISPANYLDLRAQSKSFAALAAYKQEDVNLTGEGVPERLYGSRVTANFFDVTRMTPQLGRTFLSEEDEAGRGQVAILGHGLWEQRFSGDASVLGKTIDLNGQRCTIVGVMPRDFDFPAPTDVWMPLAMGATERADRKNASLAAIGLLKAGISLERAQTEGATIASRLAATYPQPDKDLTIRAIPLVESVEGSITRAYSFLLLAAVGIVLLIACSNIANLQLARSVARQQEFAVRAALGARRWTIARLLLVENVFMAILGGAASIGLARWSLNLMRSSMPADIARLIPGWYQIRLDSRALVYTLAIAVVSGLLAGWMPALAAPRAALNESLKEGGRSGIGRSRQRLRRTFVVAQIVVALVLVTAATLMVNGFRRLVKVQESYSPKHMLIMAVNLPDSRYKTPADRVLFYNQALDKLRSIPGVAAAETFYTIPLSNNGTQWTNFGVESRAPASSQRQYPRAILQQISPGYLRTLNISLMGGRAFTDADRESSQPVAMVSQNLARSYWPGSNPIGRHVRIGGPDSKQPWLTVVGVTNDVLYDWTDQLPELAIYVPYTQSPPAETLLAIRSNGPPAANFAKPARAAIASIDPDLPPFSVMPLSQAIYESIVGLAFVGDMMAVLGVIALVIALVGVYGVMAYTVAERTHEFGVRMALGAQPRGILWLVSRQGAFLAAIAIAIGLPLAIVIARLLHGLIFGASAMDWSVFGGIAALLAIVVLFACYIPARRAMKVDPMVALRYE